MNENRNGFSWGTFPLIGLLNHNLGRIVLLKTSLKCVTSWFPESFHTTYPTLVFFFFFDRELMFFSIFIFKYSSCPETFKNTNKGIYTLG